MARAPTWSDLKLTPSEKAALRPFALSDAGAVVALAQGSPELLGRVLPPGTVGRLQSLGKSHTPAEMERFVFGVPSTPPAEEGGIDSSQEFERERARLVAAVAATTSPKVRRTALLKLKRLYGRPSSGSGVKQAG